MRKANAALLLFSLSPLLAGCGSGEQPLVPELKGRWTSPQLVKVMRYANEADPLKASPGTDACSATYVTFGLGYISTKFHGYGTPIYDVAEVKREGARVIVTGIERYNGRPGKLVLLLRNGEVRFDDIYDARGRSIKYERLDNENRLRKYGATTIGEAMSLYLDVKPCTA